MTAADIVSTYRLQMRGDAFTFADAVDVAAYLDQLGVSHLYLSPILTAADGSQHGYDVTDPTTVSDALGGSAGFEKLIAEVRSRGMGVVVDIVPNHLGIEVPRQNQWWWDVLKRGRGSDHAGYFDIDWRETNGADGKLALPVLGSAADLAQLTIDTSDSEPMLAYDEHRFPIAPGTEGDDPRAVHDRQSYRLVDWKSGLSTYRRFFTVNSLAAVRQEDPQVFDATHSAIAEWARRDLIDGVRVDHPDGLSRPAAYLERLRALVGPSRRLFVEKILGSDEPLDSTLPIEGTTGYEALAELGGLFVDPAGEADLTALSIRMTGEPGDAGWLHDAEREIKRGLAQTGLAPEVRRLLAAIGRDSGESVSTATLAVATVDVLASMPVYRADYAPLAGLLSSTIDAVRQRNPELAEPLAVLERALSADGEAAVRFNQVCGALMAKSVEDCLFYRTARLISLQEVGGSPARFGISPDDFHDANVARAQQWPAMMTTLSTHDTKRGEDVRARISVLSQVPQLWSAVVSDWEQSAPSPDGVTGLFLWQNLFGVWPSDGRPAADVPDLRERLHAYAEKAIREAGLRTSWDRVDDEFEARVHTWLDDVIDGPVGRSLDAFVASLAWHGWAISLGQKLFQLVGPGIPDVYQGTELWEDSLVDPDNRRVVDFDVRRNRLASLTSAPPLDASGSAKLWVVAHALWLRRERPASFVGGSYLPLSAEGVAADHIVAFARGPENDGADVVAVASRLTVAIPDSGWGDTALDLPEGSWTDRLSGRTYRGSVPATDLLADLPVALLVRDR
ncbi:malto-oligosyltrehalose synthase [Antrihabitans cavernicola]|uniref:Malto-oligosyltrehalose synthase n=1 Tax=Antrihabitans cavernicola TaxID=2495913 RepID=A0A5A7S9X2_9NOCA|nr:malto-oligosyltrehalose synthase [Spelaeibacter cavernicola]KAA0021021.1 malto-oligosyltrehalose synthase [Spelaeibacter cavernicola]